MTNNGKNRTIKSKKKKKNYHNVQRKGKLQLILEAGTIKQSKMKERLKRYLGRTRKRLKTKLRRVEEICSHSNSSEKPSAKNS